MDFLLSLISLKSRCSSHCILIQTVWGRGLFRVVGRIQFLAFIRLKLVFSYWLPLDIVLSFWKLFSVPSTLPTSPKPATVWNLSHASNLSDLPFCYSGQNHSALKGSCDNHGNYITSYSKVPSTLKGDRISWEPGSVGRSN